jgi:hypothetical protein
MRALSTVAILLAIVVAAATAEAKPKFYFHVRGVQVPANAPAGLKDRARTDLIEELKKQPSVVVDLGDPAPTGEELEKALKARKLEGYELMLRVTKSSHSLEPPPGGKGYKMLMVEVHVALDAQKIPSGQMALAGEGNASVGTQVTSVKEKEKQELMHEALHKALSEAAAKSINKLGASKATTPTRRKKK